MTTSVSALQENMKRNFVLDDLLKMGVTHTPEGVSVHDLSYEDLKYELVMACFRKIDSDNSENAWF